MAADRHNQRFPQLPDWLQLWVFNRTARHAYLSLFDQGVISLSNFLAAVFLARQVSATEFGIYAVGFGLLRFVRAVQEGVLVQPLNTFGAGMKPEAFQRYLTSTLLSQSVLAALTSLGALGAGSLLTAWGSGTAGLALSRLWFVFIAWPLQELLRRAFYTRGEVGKAALLSTLANLARFGVLIRWAAKGTLTGSAGMDAIGLGALAGLAFGLWAAKGYFTTSLRWQEIKAAWTQNWVFGRWMLGALLANYVALEVYPLVVAGMVSFAASGAYRALENLVAPVHVILRAMDTLITPYAARAYQNAGRQQLNRIVRRAYWIGGVPILLILSSALLFTEPLLNLLYGSAYLETRSGILWLSLFYLLWFAYWPVQSALKAIQRPRPVFTANLAAIGCMFTLGLLAIRAWGLNGAFIGQALNALVVNLILWRSWLKDRHEVKAEQEFP